MELPLRHGGVYRWKDRLYNAITLSTDGVPWESQGLMGRPFLMQDTDINYVQPDGTIISVHFQPIGHADELVDTGETDDA
jgi:hypothetical protein